MPTYHISLMSTAPATARQVADFVLGEANLVGEFISNLKLQKLLYYAQAWYLANYKKPLFEEDFEAWVHGPVIPELYHEYKAFSFKPIIKEDLDIKTLEKDLGEETSSYLRECLQAYLPFGAYDLEMMSHNEEPWIIARGQCSPEEICDVVITKESMQKFFSSRIAENDSSN
jgi:uncharacterized phage-associated protein